MRRFCFFFIALCILLMSFFPGRVFAIEDPTALPNNTFGIHILFPAELEMASKLVNSNGGDWGYVTIPIQSTDRNLEKWQRFLDECRRLHIIPIIRIATYPQGNFWTRPTIFDHLDFANFLNSLSWPIGNRYIIVYNEPNSSLEWGGAVDATHYAAELSHTIDAFKRVSEDFFIISAGLDSYAPNSGSLYKNSYSFLREMQASVPDIFTRIDGFASHSYPSSDFSTNPQYERRGGVSTYREEETFLQQLTGRTIPIFITETGWKQDRLSHEQVSNFYTYAFQNVWHENYIVAVTPFLLNGTGSAFSGFSLIDVNGNTSSIFQTIAHLPKVKGEPVITQEKKQQTTLYAPQDTKSFTNVSPSLPSFSMSGPLKSFLKWFFYR